MEGRYCRTEAFDVDRHGSDLFEAYAANEDGSMWTYMPSGPFADEAAFRAWMGPTCESEDPLFYTLIDTASRKAVGQAAYLRITPARCHRSRQYRVLPAPSTHARCYRGHVFNDAASIQ